MSTERQPDIRLTGIHINLIDHVVTLEAQDGRKAKLSFAEAGAPAETLPQQQPALASEFDTPDELVAEPEDDGWDMAPASMEPPAPDPQRAPQEARETEQTIVLSGRLHTRPKQGRLDSRGQPTAWARFAVQEEGAPDVHLYAATFHRHTVPIALGLAQGARLTVEGYLHAGDPAAKRSDTLSVIALHDYPGKSERTRPKEVRRP